MEERAEGCHGEGCVSGSGGCGGRRTCYVRRDYRRLVTLGLAIEFGRHVFS